MENLDNIIFKSLKSAERNIILNYSEKIYLKKCTFNNKIDSIETTKEFLYSFFKKLDTKYFDIEEDEEYLEELSEKVWQDINLKNKEDLNEEVGRNHHTADPNPIALDKILEDMYNEDEMPSRFEISDNVIINDNEEVYLDENDSGNWYKIKIYNNKLK